MGGCDLTARKKKKSIVVSRPDADKEPPSAKEDPILSIPEAAKLRGVHPVTMNRWLHDGHLPAVAQPGGRLAVRKSTILNSMKPVVLGRE